MVSYDKSAKFLGGLLILRSLCACRESEGPLEGIAFKDDVSPK